MKKKKLSLHLSTAKIMVFGFLAVIFLGTCLLMTPLASRNGTPAAWYDALFTSVSATCVTGLVSVDTAIHWSVFGQIVIITMIQVGGLGFMTFAVLLTNLLRRRISPKESMLLAESLSLYSRSGLDSLVKRIIIGTFSIELIGAAVLSVRFIPMFGLGRGIYMSVFHAVSAFCNAGFDLIGMEAGAFVGMTHFYSDPLILLTLSALIIVGGIGFVVWDDVKDLILHKKKLSVYSRFMLVSSAILVFGGMLAILVLEWSNPDSIGTYSVGDKLLNAYFSSVTLRTAGFSSVDFSTMTEPSQYISMILMFIGGGAGSTAGGVKVVTFMTAALAVITTAKGGTDVNIYSRRIPPESVMKAFSVIVIQLFVTLSAAIAVSVIADAPMTAALFEVFSASGTVGLSFGLTPILPVPALLVDATLMFFGRVGILTVTYALAVKSSANPGSFRYADVQFPI